ncbi:NAD(P)-dependent oxidoreductase [Nonomuraea salmonea]|uniref:NAD-dependent epimerase/dehydratase family protein n=1 Tax=Nonomuraea salmonea TaxID=46181 RepID=UPI0031E90F24
MRVVVTGAHGKVGRAAVKALAEAGHEVTATDLARPVFERHDPGEPRYLQADLTDAGQAYAITHGADAVVHAAAIPDPTSNAPHVVFHNNLMATFNLIEAAVRLGVTRFVNISSETVPGFFFAERPFLPDYAPVDEEHPARPQDPYALSKHFGEQLMDAAVRRSDIKCISLRPSWVQHEGNYERNLGPPRCGTPARSGPGSGATPTCTTSPTPSCWPSSPTCRGTRCSTSPRPTTRAGTTSPPCCAGSTATRSSCARCPGSTRRASPARRRTGCWAGLPSGRGATTWTRTAVPARGDARL